MHHHLARMSVFSLLFFLIDSVHLHMVSKLPASSSCGWHSGHGLWRTS